MNHLVLLTRGTVNCKMRRFAYDLLTRSGANDDGASIIAD